MSIDLDHLRQWIGRGEEVTDVITAQPLAGLSATLDRDDPRPAPGDPVPPSGHWLYFLPTTRQSELAEDGHAHRGGFLPPVPLPRRMWAGGRIAFHQPIRVGDAVVRRSEVMDVTLKEGRDESLVFVVVRHSVSGPGGTAIVEDHDIVYREEPRPDAPQPPPRPAPGTPVWQRAVIADSVMLFRYSALIFNGHRIHFDHTYATEVTGYPGLVVHGPLTATLLMDLCRRARPEAALTRFDYRAVRPLFDTHPFTIAGEPAADGNSARLWALDPEGALAMTATAEFAP
jgi:3-methylfumaryl-CoA hydratase